MMNQIKLFEVTGAPTRCMIPGSASRRLAHDFTIKAEFRPFIIGGKQTILSKRVPCSKGNRPGFVLLLNGSVVEFMTFEDGGQKWYTAKTVSGAITVGEYYKLLIFRSGSRATIFVNGVDRTDPVYNMAAGGDINCDVDAFIGFQVYDIVAEREPMKPKGMIYNVGIYNDLWVGAVKRERFEKNPNVVPLAQLPEMKERLFAGGRSYG